MARGALALRGIVVGNLDAEYQHASGTATLARPLLARPLLARLSALATLLRVFARDGDGLWTLLPVDAARLPEPIGGGGSLRWLAGAPSPSGCPRLPWAETTLEARIPAEQPRGGSWIDSLWAIPPSMSGAPKTWNDRRTALDLAVELGEALPAATRVASRRELQARLAEGVCAASPSGEWVAKAPWCAAGRERARGRGASVDTQLSAQLDRLFARYGELVLEPWMDRRGDLGVAGVVYPDRVRILGTHVQGVDARGQFLSVRGAIAGERPAELSCEDSTRLVEIALAVGARMREGGYRGPFGIDAWRYRVGAVGSRLHALGEINARLTFGIVARAWAEHIRAVSPRPDDVGEFALALGAQPGSTHAFGLDSTTLLYAEDLRTPLASLGWDPASRSLGRTAE